MDSFIGGGPLFDQGKLVLTNTPKFLSLGFPQKCRPEGWTGNGWTMVPGNCDLNIVAFFKEHPEYEYYWAIEYDVYYEGKWQFLFNRFKSSKADLLGTTIYKANETPDKILNPPLKSPDGNAFNLDNAIRGFFPICRMSKKGLQLIVDEYQKGWDGHQELLLGTILNMHGLSIEDIGGDGDFVRPENRNAFYFNSYKTCSLSPGNFVFRSFAAPLKKENTLWHPVKPEGSYAKHSPVVRKNMVADFINFTLKPLVAKTALHLWFALIWRKQT